MRRRLLLDADWMAQATPAAVQAMLDHGAEVNARTQFGETPLHAAARHNDNLVVISQLLDRGAEVNARDEWDRTPLHAAVEDNHNPAVVTLLLDRGAQT